MTSISYLTEPSLFAGLPQDHSKEVSSFYDRDYVESAPYSDLIDITHQLITSGTIQQEKDLLIIWEIRLTLLLFDNRLSAAKLEAVNLNNALFFHENPTSSTGKPGTTPGQTAPAANYPLPKNNAGLISYLLLMLVLRLKSTPNLALVNELYKLCYQIRLKGVTAEAQSVQMKLFNLSYEIISVLLTSRHHLALLWFLQSLKRDTSLRIEKPGDNEQTYKNFLSNISLIWIYLRLIIRRGKEPGEKPSAYGEQFEQEWSSIKTSTKQTLIDVLNGFPSSSDQPVIGLDPIAFLVTEFADLVDSGTISTRIISCTLATWDLENKPFTESDFNRGKSEENDQDASSLEKTYSVIMAKWSRYADKVYGMA